INFLHFFTIPTPVSRSSMTMTKPPARGIATLTLLPVVLSVALFLYRRTGTVSSLLRPVLIFLTWLCLISFFDRNTFAFALFFLWFSRGACFTVRRQRDPA